MTDRFSRFAQRYTERLNSAREATNYAYWINRPISQGSILYESVEGKSLSGTPERLFTYLLKQNDLMNLVHIWSVSDSQTLDTLRDKYALEKNIRFVKRGDASYFRALATSGYLINDQEFPQEFLKRQDQIFLHTADVETIGSLGIASLSGAIENRNIFKNLLSADYLISDSALTTKSLLMGSFRLNNVFGGKILETCLIPETQQRNELEEDSGVLLAAQMQSSAAREQDMGSSAQAHENTDVSRIVDVVFRNQGQNFLRDCSEDGRKTILLYPGGMVPNGITTSALNLLHNIDYERFDVTVICSFSEDHAKFRMFDQLNPKVRIVFRDGRFAGGFVSNKLRSWAMLGNAVAKTALGKRNEHLWSLEWRRCFGESSFEHAIDFSGYSPFWGELFRHGETRTRTIWMHNDLAADSERVIHGQKPHRKNLMAVFGSYKHFDNLVSVSERLRDINRMKLSEWAPASRFTFARNTLNLERIRKLAVHEDETPNVGNNRMASISRRFVTVGRLSPEKNHARLISAFALVLERNADAQLVIVGDGPLMSQLKSQVNDLGLTASVIFTGHTDNPYSHMNDASTFVLSSDYEGQPMVLLEALVIGLPVITTAFGSVEGALPEGVGTIVECNADALGAAMMRVPDKKQKSFSFDAESYNHDVLGEFEAIFGS